MKYSGNLLRPVVRTQFGPLADESAIAQESNRVASELGKKIPLLFKAHGVDDGDYMALAFALAKEHVPGFKVVPPAGRPEEWTAYDKAAFKVDIDRVRASEPPSGTPMSLRDAIRQVMGAEAWKPRVQKMTGRDGKLKVAALEQHYYAAGRATHEHAKSADAWLRIAEAAKKAE